MKSPLLAPFVSAIVLVALAAAAPAQENVWTTHGPTGAGVVSDVAVGDGVAYAATPTGVFRSRDGGATWIQTTLTGEWIVQVVARPGTTVVLAVASPTLYLSRDEGDTWAPVPDVPSQAAAIDPGQPSTLYSGAYQGIWRSTDSGANWLQLSTAPTANTGISFAFDSRAVYVLGFAPTNRYELQQSRDGGVSWAIVSTPIPSPTAVAAGVASGLVYIGGSGTFCRSADSTATWTCSSFPDADAPFLIREVPADGSGAAPRILAISDAGAYASSDGTTWVRETVELDATGSVETFASDASGSLVLAGTNIGIFRSPDHGDTWTPASVGLRSSAINALAVGPQDPSTVWAIGYGFDGKDSGLFRSGDAGLTWSLGRGPDGSFGALAIDPEHSSTLYAGGSGVYRSLDGGGVWTGSTLPGGAVVHSLAADPRLPERVWAASSGGLFRSDDGVQSWTSSPAVAQEVYSILFDGKQPGTMYAGSYFDDVEGGYYPGPEGGSIFVSRDSGASWTKNAHDFDSPVFAIAADPFLDGVLYAGTAVDGVFRSTDDGVTWQASNLHLIGIASLVADPVRPGRLYCTTWDGAVYRTTDGAQTWQPFSSGLEPFAAQSLVISADGRWLHAGTFGGGVYEFDLAAPQPCVSTGNRLCLVGNRYAVELLAARAGEVPSISGAARSLGDRAGYFALPFATGDATLPEVVVKMLPEGTLGRRNAPVFYASLTTLPYRLEITDTMTGASRSYDGDSLCGGADLFSIPSDASSLRGASAEATSTLTLLGGRFSITIDARKPGGSPATPVVMASGDSFGVFSIPDVSGDAAFPEIVVKMIDGRPVNGSFWFFETNLTTLDYTLIVLDRVTGKKEVWDGSVPFCGSDETSLFNDSPWDY